MSAALSSAITVVFLQRWMAVRTAGVAIHHICLWMIKAMSEAPISVACIQQHSPLCHPQRIREPGRFFTYFRILLTAHLLRLKNRDKDEIKSEKEMKKKKTEYRYSGIEALGSTGSLSLLILWRAVYQGLVYKQ